MRKHEEKINYNNNIDSYYYNRNNAIFFILKGKCYNREYQPEEEISNEQMRQTIVSLYYKNKETGELMPEGRIIDSKKLLGNPYKKLVELLIEQPKNDKLESAIPNETKGK